MLEWIVDKHAGSGMVEPRWDPTAALQLRQGTDQSCLSGKLGACGIREILPRTRNDELNDRVDEEGDRIKEGAKDDHSNDPPLALVAIGAVASGELPSPAGQQECRADNRTDDQQEKDVAMLDVAELMSHDSIQLVVTHDVEESGGDGQRGVLCIASGGEGVRRRIVHYEDFGLGTAGA